MRHAIAPLRRFAALALLYLAAPVVAQPYAYIPNYGSSTVSVVNTATNTVITTIPLPIFSYPFSIAANAAGTKVYIGHSYRTLSVIDTATNTAAAAVALPQGCYNGMAVNPSGTRGYAVSHCSDNVAVLDLTASPVTVLANLSGVGFNRPYGAVVSPDGSRVYVANYYGQNVAVINTATNTVSFIATPMRNPFGIALDSTGNNLWISHRGTPNGATRISNPAGTPFVGAGIATGTDPSGIALNAAGTTVYVANQDSNTISAINTATQAVTGSAETGDGPVGVSITPDGSRVLVANASSNSVSVFNANLSPLATVAVGLEPYSLGIFISTYPGPPSFDPAAAIAALRDSITATILTDTHLRNVLLAPLNAAYSWLSGNDPKRINNACENLAKFVTTVGRNYKYGKLTYAEASAMVEDASAIRVELSCRNPYGGALLPPT